jgi:hypothetical protein
MVRNYIELKSSFEDNYYQTDSRIGNGAFLSMLYFPANSGKLLIKEQTIVSNIRGLTHRIMLYSIPYGNLVPSMSISNAYDMLDPY